MQTNRCFYLISRDKEFLVRERSALATIIFTFRVCLSGCQDVCPSFQNATCPSVLDRFSWYFNTMVPYLGKIILLHGFLIRASWRQRHEILHGTPSLSAMVASTHTVHKTVLLLRGVMRSHSYILTMNLKNGYVVAYSHIYNVIRCIGV